MLEHSIVKMLVPNSIAFDDVYHKQLEDYIGNEAKYQTIGQLC